MNTLGELIDARDNLRAYCMERVCGHSAKLDLVKLAAKLGRDHGALHDALVPHLFCTKCGSKNISLIRTPYYGEGAGYPGHII